MVHVYYTYTDPGLPNDAFYAFLSQLPPRDQRRVERYRHWTDRQTHLIGRMLLQYGLLQHGFPKETIHQIRFSPFGKPFIEGELFFSLSHAPGIVVCAISEHCDVGIDVESLQRENFAFIRSVMTPPELKQWASANNEQRALCAFWTRKEAVAKADGRGLRVPIDQIQLGDPTATLSGRRWYLQAVGLESDHLCHLAVKCRGNGFSANEVALQTLQTGAPSPMAREPRPEHGRRFKATKEAHVHGY